ncbi:MAG: transporter substrate-binding domain-containing protein, partial [Lachnospiraceae bacterium]
MKKQCRKIGILIMAVVMMLSACSHNQDAVSGITPGQSDLEYVQSKGTIVVGITDFEPLDYRDGEEWTGFDAELAKGFAESLGVTLEFKE